MPTYPTPEVRAILEKTLGVPLFQEQAMKLAMVAAGFTAGEADGLRRALGHKRAEQLLEPYRLRFVEGGVKRGYSQEYMEELFEQFRGFAHYGFPESHSASFALIAYASSWLKCHYPQAFTAALLNSQPMGFYAPHTLVADAQAPRRGGAAGGRALLGLGLHAGGGRGAAAGAAHGARAERVGRQARGGGAGVRATRAWASWRGGPASPGTS